MGWSRQVAMRAPPNMYPKNRLSSQEINGRNLCWMLFVGLFVMGGYVMPVVKASETCFNKMKSIGTHNSYHLAPQTEILEILKSSLVRPRLPADAYLPEAWEYEHLKLNKQLDAGVRFLELDLYPDPEGGKYSSPAALKLAGIPARLDDPAYQEPGWKVLHIPDIDFRTTCVTFKNCLEVIKAWSDANPSHQPIVVFLDVKYQGLSGVLGSNLDDINSILAISPVEGPDSVVEVPTLTRELLIDLENEIWNIFDESSLISEKFIRQELRLPQDVNVVETLRTPPRDDYCSWPSLETMKGKVMFGFIFWEDDVTLYKDLHSAGQNVPSPGWLVWDNFVNGDYISDAIFYTGANGDLSNQGGVIPPTIPSDASNIIDGMVNQIESAHSQGYVTRARTDVNTIEARSDFAERSDALLKSSANFIATDFINPSALFPSSYSVSLAMNDSLAIPTPPAVENSEETLPPGQDLSQTVPPPEQGQNVSPPPNQEPSKSASSVAALNGLSYTVKTFIVSIIFMEAFIVLNF